MKGTAELKRVFSDYRALESIDGKVGDFRSRARLLQSIWRVEQGYEPATYRGTVRGARLQMPWAKDSLPNYLTENIREGVRAEVLDEGKSRGKLYGKPRIFDNLLSSQPLCFNLFGELQQDLELTSAVFRKMTDGWIQRVTAIQFEYSPGRGQSEFTADNSAFDVFLVGQNRAGESSFVGIEVKYHENLDDEEATFRPRYLEISNAMGCFRPEALPKLRLKPLEQIWRDHMLAGALIQSGRFTDGRFVFLYPEQNEYCSRAVDAYLGCLTAPDTFDAWTLESIAETIQDVSDADWVELFVDRYLNFEKVDERLRND